MWSRSVEISTDPRLAASAAGADRLGIAQVDPGVDPAPWLVVLGRPRPEEVLVGDPAHGSAVLDVEGDLDHGDRPDPPAVLALPDDGRRGLASGLVDPLQPLGGGLHLGHALGVGREALLDHVPFARLARLALLLGLRGLALLVLAL